MRTVIVLLAAAASMFAQAVPGGPASPNYVRYQPTYDEVKGVLNLTDDQIAQLKQMQQDKMASTQAFYTKMADKQKELNKLLEDNSSDPAKVGQLMLELQQLRKQPPPGGTDVHDKAVAVLNHDQKLKLARMEEAQKMRGAVDQAMQLGLLSPIPAKGGEALPRGAGMRPMTAPKPADAK